MRIALLSVALCAAVQQYTDTLLNFLERIDLDQYAYQQQPSMVESYEGADVMAPAQFIQDEEYYEGQEGYYELQGFQIVEVPYYELPDGALLSQEEFEPLAEDYEVVSAESFQDYQDRFDLARVPQSQQWAAFRNFFSRVGDGLKKAGQVIHRVAKVALPIMKFIPGPIGLAARAIDMGIKVGEGIHAAVQAGRRGGVGAAFKALGSHALNAATDMIPGGKFLKMGKGLIGGGIGGVAKGLIGGGARGGIGGMVRNIGGMFGRGGAAKGLGGIARSVGGMLGRGGAPKGLGGIVSNFANRAQSGGFRGVAKQPANMVRRPPVNRMQGVARQVGRAASVAKGFQRRR